MKFASLGSGSDGNALLIAAESSSASTVVMLDCGFSVKETAQRLDRLGVAPTDVSGIVVTHEHSDHVGGVFKLARKYRIPVWLTYGTFCAVKKQAHDVDIRFCQDGKPIGIGSLELHPFTVPHDAREPVQFVATDAACRLGILTDAGHATPHMIDALGQCDALVLECNHDQKLLLDSIYPASLKHRIGGAYGHLSNASSTHILKHIDKSRLKLVIAAHLSKINNTAALAHAALVAGLGTTPAHIDIACQANGFDWVDLKKLI